MEKVVTKWDLTRDIQFRTRVVGLKWLEEEGKWKIRIRKNGSKEEERDEIADVVISAQGFLR
jgi:cation diffusion facilitator CzcD-associated flavoprotein CzcO